VRVCVCVCVCVCVDFYKPIVCLFEHQYMTYLDSEEVISPLNSFLLLLDILRMDVPIPVQQLRNRKV
jgi:hypothetical protein